MPQSVDAYAVPRGRLNEIWPAVEPLLRPAMERSGEMPISDLLAALYQGRFVLWLAWGAGLEAAAVTEIADTINGRVCCIVACGGRDRDRWIGLRARLEHYARSEGCRQMRIYGRKGWARVLPDYRETRVILEKDL